MDQIIPCTKVVQIDSHYSQAGLIFTVAGVTCFAIESLFLSYGLHVAMRGAHVPCYQNLVSPSGNLAQTQKHRMWMYSIKEMALVIWHAVCNESTHWPKAEEFLKQMFRQDGQSTVEMWSRIIMNISLKRQPRYGSELQPVMRLLFNSS